MGALSYEIRDAFQGDRLIKEEKNNYKLIYWGALSVDCK